MNSQSLSRWRRAARFFFAWMLMLLGLCVATPAIAIIVEAVLPYFERTPWRGFFNHYTLGEIARGFTRLLPSMIIWALAWAVRIGRPLHPAVFCVAALLTSPLLGYGELSLVPVLYLLLAGVMYILRQSSVRPWTPRMLHLHLACAIPEFRQWPADSHDGEPTFLAVFTQFSGCYRQRYAAVSQLWLHEIGTLVSECVAADNLVLRESGICFLEQLTGDPSLDRLHPYLSQQALDVIARKNTAIPVA